MSLVVSAFSLAIMAIGALGVVSPDALVSFVRRWQSPLGIWAAAAIRVAFGAALWLAAPASRTPIVLEILGALSVASGIALPLLGLSRFTAILSWWAGRSALCRRTWAGMALLFGGFLLWAVTV